MAFFDCGLTDDQVKNTHLEINACSTKLATFHLKISNAWLLSHSYDEGRRKHGGSFWGEMGKDEIHWWVFKKEKNIEGLRKETELLLPLVKNLKDNARRLSFSLNGEYSDLFYELDNFVKRHDAEIAALHNYVEMLGRKNELAPCIFFTYRVWGTTNLNMRISVDEHFRPVYFNDLLESLETALGLKVRSEPTADWVWVEIRNVSGLEGDEFQEYIESESGANDWLRKTIDRVLEQFITYFDNIQQTVRNILLEIEQYYDVEHLLSDREFWANAILHAMEFPVEDQLWDFKETLEMWRSTGQAKLQHEVDFCENVAAYANANGGVLVIGITDQIPRKVVGVNDSENKIKHLNDVISKRCKYQQSFVRIIPVVVQREMCLLVISAQTKGVIGVVDERDKYSYPRRQGTGIKRLEQAVIESSKQSVSADNFNFISDIERITNGGFISYSYSD